MDKDRLYAMEILVKKIKFGYCLEKIPQKDAISVHASFRNFVDMNTGCEDINPFCSPNPELSSNEVDLDLWSCQEFCCKPENLLKALSSEPLTLQFMKKWNPVPFGVVRIPWNVDFVDMVANSQWNPTHSTTVSSRKDYELISQSNGKVLGEVDVFVQLSSSITSEII